MKLFKMKQPQKKWIIGTFILLLAYQNCSQPGSIGVNSIDLSSTKSLEEVNPVDGVVGVAPPTLATPQIKTFETHTVVNVDLNSEVEFTLTQVTEESLQAVQILKQSLNSKNGVFQIIDEMNYKLKYKPQFGFRGSDTITLKAVDKYGNLVNFIVSVNVDNPLQNIRPALAIRGIGCLQCHAKVESNIITDYGYGNDYYFGLKNGIDWWKSSSIYGDHGFSSTTMNLNSSIQVVVPKANLPENVKVETKMSTLAEYFKARFQVSVYERSKAVTVTEKNKVYIGAPTEADITKAFAMSSSVRKLYYKNSDQSVDLQGLTDEGTYFKNSGPLYCEGDLALRGPLYLNNLEVKSATGCRLYVIGSVFIYGPIVHNHTSEMRNLQITSTSSILMGLGLTKKDDKFCDPQSHYALYPESFAASSIETRTVSHGTVAGFFTRQALEPKKIGQAIVAESKLIEAKEGVLYDASCRSEGRSVAYERIFLNAPSIQSRYQGDVFGTMVAEYALMSLGNFKFKYDTVFDKVSILPFLKSQIYLSVE